MLGRGDTSGSQVTTSSSIVGSRRDGREERHGLGLTATSTAERFALAITFLVAAAGSLFLTLGLDLQHSPDATLYTSGFSLFPSPLGTALGTLLGIEGLAIVQAVVIGTVAVSIVVLRVPLRSVVVALPLLIWLAPLGVRCHRRGALRLGLVASTGALVLGRGRVSSLGSAPGGRRRAELARSRCLRSHWASRS